MRAILAGDEPIPQRATNQLVLAAVIEVHGDVRKLRNEVANQGQQLDGVVEWQPMIEGRLNAGTARMDANEKRSKRAERYSIALWIRRNPKMAAAIGGAAVLASVWLNSGFWRLVLVALGVPPEIIEMLAGGC